MGKFELDESWREFATDRQWELLTAWGKHGSRDGAASALGVAPSTLQAAKNAVESRAARRGYAPSYEYTDPVPPGFRLRGERILYDADGNVRLKWVKSAADLERQQEIVDAFIAAMSDQIPRVEAKPLTVEQKGQLDAALCVAYPVGDHHFGMLAWDKETGDDWDLTLAEDALNKAMDYLTAASPPAGRGLLVFLGDYMHYDGFIPQTARSKNFLDSDSRFPKMVRGGIRAMRYAVSAALARHEYVDLIIEIGNHDDASAIWLMELMAVAYENEPRVTVNTSPMRMHYHRFGRNLIGVTHGDQVKMQDMPLLMAVDRRKDWGETKHRFVWTGHWHRGKQQQLPVTATDVGGVSCECFRILAPPDAWAAGMGYRSIRNMHSIVLHREYGEVSRHTVNPGMFK